MSNESTAVAKRPSFSMMINSEKYQKLILSTLQDEGRTKRFTARIVSTVSTSPALQECDFLTVLSGSLIGETLNLLPSPQLGQYYLVPFKEYNKDGSVKKINAVFVLGYKGYIQLAERSGQYRHINAIPVKEGELKSWNPFTEELIVTPISDDLAREAAPTIGYYAMFEYLNGFKKAMYWSKDKMLVHADRFSKAFNKDSYRLLLEGKIPEKDMWKYSSFWYKEFDDMGLKTMLRQLISKWGIMSDELQTAFEADDHATSDPIHLVPDEDGIYDEETPIITPEGQGEAENPEKHQGNASKPAKDGQQKIDEV